MPFQFAADFDIDYECLKTGLSFIENVKGDKITDGASWPLFKHWLLKQLKFLVANQNINVKDFVDASAVVGAIPYRFSCLVDALIKSKVDKTILVDYDETDGINLYYALDTDLAVITVFERVKLLKSFLMNLNAYVSNEKKFKDEMKILEYHFPAIKNLSSAIVCFSLNDANLARYLRENNFKDKTQVVTDAFTATNYKSILKEFKQLRKEGLIHDVSTSISDAKVVKSDENSVEAFVSIDKVRCYNCKKFGHYSNKCPLKKKSNNRFVKREEVQLIEVPLDAEVFVTTDENNERTSNNKVEEETYFAGESNSLTATSKENVIIDVNSTDSWLKEETKKINEFEIYFVQEHLSTEFVVDTGATAHITNDKSILSNIVSSETVIKGVNGSNKVEWEGDVNLGNLCLRGVKLVPQSPRNIISVRRLNNQGYGCSMLHDCKITKDGVVLAKPKTINNLWILKPTDVLEQMVFNAEEQRIQETADSDVILSTHVKNGHCSLNQLKTILGENYSIAEIRASLKQCITCASVVPKSNIKKLPQTEFIVGEQISADLIGPINNAYGLIISDRKSKFAIARVLKFKSEVSAKTVEILQVFKRLLALTQKSVCFFKADNEFDTNQINEYCNQEGISTQFTAAHSSYQNGAAENMNYQIEKKMHLFLLDSGLTEEYWNFAFHHAVFINNYVPRNKNTQSAWEILRCTSKQAGNISPFGCRVFAHNYNKRQKIFKKDISGVFLGYHKTTKIALVLEDYTDRIIRTSAFKTVESIFPFKFNKKESKSNETNSSYSMGGGFSGINSASTESNKDVEQTDSSVSIQGQEDTEMMDVVNTDSSFIPSDIEIEGEHELDDSSSNLQTNEENEIPNVSDNDELMDSRNETNDLIVNPVNEENEVVAASDPTSNSKILVERTRNPNTLIVHKSKSSSKTDNDPLNILSTSSVLKRRRNASKRFAPLKRIVSEQPQKMITDGSLITDIRDTSDSSDASCSSEDEINLLVSKNKYHIPESYSEAIQTEQKSKWIAACAEEYMSIKNNNVFDLIDSSSVKDKVIRGRWVFNVKNEHSGERFKARLVAKGFSQTKGENFVDVYAPVMGYDTLRFVLATAAINEWKLAQLDAKNAFLNGPIDYPVYFQPPPGTDTPVNKIWKLNKGLYGLKQSPHIWFNTVKDVIVNCGYKQSVLEPCLFVKSDSILAIYVDDILISGQTDAVIDKVRKELETKFVMKFMGYPDVFLGITIAKTANGIKMSLTDFISKLAEDYAISKEKIIPTPLVTGFDAYDNSSEQLNETDHSKYRSIVGCLLFIANTVRLDIAFATSLLSRFLVTPRTIHLKAAFRVLQYLVQTKDFGIHYSKAGSLLTFKDFRYLDKTKDVSIHDYPHPGTYQITTVSDSDYAADKQDRKSQSGNITYLNNNIISWCSRKQTCVALSSTESEYIGLSEAVKTSLFFKNLLSELSYSTSYINLCGDNLSSLTLSAHKAVHQKTKHIDVRFHFVRNLVCDKIVKLNYINTKVNVADILTKVVDTTTFQSLLKLVLSPTSGSVALSKL